jgi:hypothetical protein
MHPKAFLSLIFISLFAFITVGCNSSQTSTSQATLVDTMAEAKSLSQKEVYLSNLKSSGFDFAESIAELTTYINALGGDDSKRIAVFENIIDKINIGDMICLAKLLHEELKIMRLADEESIAKSLTKKAVAVIPNIPPIGNDDEFTTEFETAITIDVLKNDTDSINDTLKINGVETPSDHGIVVINSNQTLTYTPNTAFSGIDTFRYTLKDTQGNVKLATVTITVKPKP